MTLNYGSIHIERGTGSAMSFHGYWEIDYEFSPDVTQFPADSRLGWDLGKIKRVVYVIDARLKSTSDAETFLATLKTLQVAGTMTLELQIESADYFKIDGTNTSIEVLCHKIKGIKKMSPGYGTPATYGVNSMIFEEAG